MRGVLYLYLLKFGHHSITESANSCLGSDNGGRSDILNALRGLGCALPAQGLVRSGSVMSRKGPYVHKHAAALQLVELGIGIIQNLIFEVTREGICTLVLIF